MNPELFALYRPSQIHLQVLERVVHPYGEDLVAVLALALAPVHGYVRPSHELLGIVLADIRACGDHRDPYAARHDRLMVVHLERNTQGPFDPLGDLGGLLAHVF